MNDKLQSAISNVTRWAGSSSLLDEDVLDQSEAHFLIYAVEEKIARLRSANDDGDLDDEIDKARRLLKKLQCCMVLKFQD